MRTLPNKHTQISDDHHLITREHQNIIFIDHLRRSSNDRQPMMIIFFTLVTTKNMLYFSKINPYFYGTCAFASITSYSSFF